VKVPAHEFPVSAEMWLLAWALAELTRIAGGEGSEFAGYRGPRFYLNDAFEAFIVDRFERAFTCRASHFLCEVKRRAARGEKMTSILQSFLREPLELAEQDLEVLTAFVPGLAGRGPRDGAHSPGGLPDSDSPLPAAHARAKSLEVLSGKEKETYQL
jgi:hypothetical protein